MRLFYLRSRGLPRAEARALLTTAFCREVVAGIDDTSLRSLLAEDAGSALQDLGA
jgi:Fe-S cluster assembly protein SufD